MLNDLYHALDPVAFSAGPITIYWYGISYVVGALIAGIVMWRTQRRWRLDIFMTNHGGMSFHGGLVGGIAGGVIACRSMGLSAGTMADLAAIGAPVALCLGRCANFVNGELWGQETDLPWGVVFGGAAGDVARHPSQLYEAFLEGFVLFAVLELLSRREPVPPRGTFMGVFVLGYGIARILVEFVRVPDAQLGYLFGGVVTMGQLLSLPLVVAGIVLIVYARRRALPQTDYLEPRAS